ncbi:MAG TPA: VTT domain-containing protein [Vicinamibacterales bacterium]|nr:VTT domain-containing protein [Vicinamibacterales bacterium]
MKGLGFWAQASVASLGATGLFGLAFLDASFLSLPQVVDLLVVVMVIQNKSGVLIYPAVATIGSVAGCLVLYLLTRKGGEALLRRRFAARRVEHGMALFRRYGLLAVLVPSVLPPPTPFKLFVLLAGISGVSPARFTLAVLIGRSLRFFAIAFLAFWFGDRALGYISENATMAGLLTAGLFVLGGLGYYLFRRRRRARGTGAV